MRIGGHGSAVLGDPIIFYPAFFRLRLLHCCGSTNGRDKNSSGIISLIALSG